MFESNENFSIDPISKSAFAKLTLTLRILDKREDGFNNLEALTVFLPEVSDRLTLSPQANEALTVTASELDIPSDDSNLVIKARDLFVSNERASLFPGLSDVGFELNKNIPVAAGLGGGSSDAAAALHLLNRFCAEPFTITELLYMARDLGSDVSACVYSQALWMRGRGEIVEPLDDFFLDNDVAALVVTPDIFCSTPKVYAKYEEMGRPRDDGVNSPPAVANYTQTLHNDLSIAAFQKYPQLSTFKAELESLTGMNFVLAGSGSTLFCIAEREALNAQQAQILGHFKGLRLCAISEVM